MTIRWLSLCCGVLLLGICLSVGPAGAAGTIDHDIESIGVGRAPTQGTITVDENAGAKDKPGVPSLGTMDPLGTMTGTFPDLPDFGDGSDPEGLSSL